MDAVEDIKGRLSIEDVISRYVELKRAGRNFKGLSPFSSEKTASFMVSPEKQIWHDFSSGKGGNMFSFVMEMEGLEFKGALELLARQAGVDLTQYRGSYDAERGKQKERLYQELELATKFYQVHFSKNREALEYILKKRGFSKETALEFKIGYSPDDGTALAKFLKSKGFSEEEMKHAGLVTVRYNDARDMFRGRIMIPLMDPQGRVVGFTARLLRDEPNAPKYINTPATPIYDKSRHVFGLHLAKDAIRKNNYVVLVEGNLDVIASHQAGVKQTVATAGTAMTEQHLKALGRFTQNVRLAFDQDVAGLAATERAIPIAAKTGVSLSIIDVDAKDPDELIQKDPKAWEKVVTKPKYALDWLVEQYQKRLDIKSAQGKRELSDVVLKLVSGLEDKVEQDHYIVQLAKLIDVSPDALRTKLGKPTSSKPLKRPNKSTEELQKDIIDQTKNQNHLLALVLHLPELRKYLNSIKKDMFNGETAQKILEFLKKHDDFELKGNEAKLPSTTGDFVKILILLYEELYQGREILELRLEAARLQTRLIENYVKIEKTKLSEAMRDSDETKSVQLLEKAKEFDLLLKEVAHD